MTAELAAAAAAAAGAGAVVLEARRPSARARVRHTATAMSCTPTMQHTTAITMGSDPEASSASLTGAAAKCGWSTGDTRSGGSAEGAEGSASGSAIVAARWLSCATSKRELHVPAGAGIP
ncbi:MAG: hypothetical protein ACK4GD_12930, partial [Sphingomonadaceae bacterium]